MPELPEVETYRRYIEGTSLYQTIRYVEVDDPEKLLLIPYDEFRDRLLGRQMTGSRRVGKNLFMALDDGQWLYMHFGMSGDVFYYRDDADRPRHARVVFYFDSGFKLGFICPRKFERLSVVDDVDEFLRQKKVAADAMEVSENVFRERLTRRQSPVKAVLLDQAVVAGIGNWIVDDVLFMARVHPETVAATLSDSQVHRIFESMRAVIGTAIEAEANYDAFPDDFLIHARGWGQRNAVANCPNCEETLTVGKVGGRTTYYCQTCQKDDA